MKVLQTIIFLLMSNILFSQNKTNYNVLSSTGDTTFWVKYQQIVMNELSLPRLDTSRNLFYFRVWKANQVIDISSNINDTYSAKITTWTSEYVPENEKHTNRILIYKVAISADTVHTMLSLIKSSTILNLPTDNLIKGWKQGLDGITYIIEYSTNEQYSFKTYWTPQTQDNLREAKLVLSLVDSIFELAAAKNIWQTFSKTIPYECYINGGNIACKILTKKEQRSYARERKNYRNRTGLKKN